MEDQTTQPSPGSSSAAYPRWVLLEMNYKKNDEDEDSSCSTPADVKTLAAARTTSGYPIQVSLRLAEPPAASCVCLQLQVPDDVDVRYPTVVAAHGDSVLIQVTVTNDLGGFWNATTDHFVYNAGAAAAEPPREPSLSMLPPYYITDDYSGPQAHQLHTRATGLIRRGEDELVVAELSLKPARKDSLELKTAELLLFRSGEWILKRPRMSYGDREFGELPLWLHTDTVVPIGDRVLCWVNLVMGLLFCDVFEESPILQYVQLPMDPCYGKPSNRNVCVTDGGGALKFVNIFPRCCCGFVGATGCQRSHGVYVVNTWTLRMSDMEWVKDGMVDATELWALDAYKGLPRIPLSHPVVSIDEPYVICFLMIEDNKACYRDQTVWMLMVDTRSKTIQSVSLYQEERRWYPDTLIPSNVSYYLNSYPTSRSDGTSKSNGQSQIDIERSLVQVRDDDASKSMLQSSCKLSTEPAVQASEILAALQEIPSYGLDHDDMLKAAYRILSHGNGHRFRSLLSLPRNLRKDWLLMEIKASED
ncbi:uncharacterized protein [Setaria viridis]|uniref:DUF1618 domain-containing protein n=1 Tax=Setaria viridis TaxID=4556 RepID=A0A4V6D2Q9_SETVI|nr:uncharacterized protein LOC117834216 [Setaria viridis]TKV99575.1 hypothetical protein SEVIR_8G052800v2 [Setaria viridis]